MSAFISSCLHDEVDDIFWRKTTKFQRLLSVLFIQPLGYNPFNIPTLYNFLQHFNFINLSFLIMGVALVFKGFDAPLHKHKEKETYFFVYGTGKMHLGGKVQEVSSPARIDIPGDVVHAMTPVTDFVLLIYVFYEGPFETIEYTYMGPKMVEKANNNASKSPPPIPLASDLPAS